MPAAAPRSGDSPDMTEAIDRLLCLGFDVRRPQGNPYQIKVAPFVSYYPTTGRIVPDGRQPLQKRGLGELIRLLERGVVEPGE